MSLQIRRLGVFVLAVLMLATTDRARAAVIVTSVANTGSYTPDEMTVDRANGEIYLLGFPSPSAFASVVKVSGGGVTTLYSTLPGTTGGNLTYSNGFAVDGVNLWWNNANSGPGGNTELSRAPKTGAGPITRTSPANDLDSLSYGGTALYSAHYAGSLYSVTPTGGLTGLGFYRSTSHLTLAGDGGSLYVADDTGAYVRNPGGTFTNIIAAPSTYRTNGSRLAVSDGYLWALDRTNFNGFWQIPIGGGAATFITDPAFTDLRSIGYYNGDVFVADTGGAGAGNVWQVTVPEPASASLVLIGAAVLTCARQRRGSRG
ncbi:MAG: hypothetical protein QOE14_2656 [Humisphaera sp.]|nr:hypothetical protein [Humisphaera sp.]